jgi:hypothetical protein
MDKLKELVKEMEDNYRAVIKRDGEYEECGEEGVRLAVYEDLLESLNYEFSDVAYK